MSINSSMSTSPLSAIRPPHSNDWIDISIQRYWLAWFTPLMASYMYIMRSWWAYVYIHGRNVAVSSPIVFIPLSGDLGSLSVAITYRLYLWPLSVTLTYRLYLWPLSCSAALPRSVRAPGCAARCQAPWYSTRRPRSCPWKKTLRVTLRNKRTQGYVNKRSSLFTILTKWKIYL